MIQFLNEKHPQLHSLLDLNIGKAEKSGFGGWIITALKLLHQ